MTRPALPRWLAVPATAAAVFLAVPLLAMLARVLAEPATMFARAVKAVADKQGGGEVAVETQAEPA